MNERGFPAITAARSLARLLVSFYLRPDLRFRSFLPPSLRRVASFQLPFSLRSRLQGRCNLDAYARRKMEPSPARRSYSRHETSRVITLIILRGSWFGWVSTSSKPLREATRTVQLQLLVVARIRKCAAKIKAGGTTWPVSAWYRITKSALGR